MVVLGHGGQQEAVSVAEGDEEMHLVQAAGVGDALLPDTRVPSTRGTTAKITQVSARERWARKKSMGAQCRQESEWISREICRFPAA